MIGLGLIAVVGLALALTRGAPGTFLQEPQLDAAVEVSSRRIARPARSSPSEEFISAKGETVYFTEDEYHAVQTLGAFGFADELAQVLKSGSAEEKAASYVAMAKRAAERPGGEALFAIYRVGDPYLGSLDPSPAVAASRAELNELVGCRFSGSRVPACAARANQTEFMWGGWITFGASLLLSAVVLGLTRTREAKPKDDPSEAKDDPSEAKGEAGASASNPKTDSDQADEADAS